MALTYRAPGVFVEEIPSARQPIAGVGTNTVGFIGIVPDEIWCPVHNPHYDPVLAQNLLAFQRLAPSGQAADAEIARRQLQAAIDSQEAEVSQAEDDVAAARVMRAQRQSDVEAAEAAQRDLGEAATDAQRTRATRDLTRTQGLLATADQDLTQKTTLRDQRTTALAQLRSQLEAPVPAPVGPVPAPVEPAPAPTASLPVVPETEIAPPDPNLNLDVPVRFRPYHLKKFTVQADEFDTKLCTNFSEYTARFGDFSAFKDNNPNEVDPSKKTFQPYYPGHHLLTHAVDGFFRNGGTRCFVARLRTPEGLDRVLSEFESIEEVSILAAPGLPKDETVWGALEDYCENAAHQNVFAILDSPLLVEDKDGALDVEQLDPDSPKRNMPRSSKHAAFYFPHIQVADPAKMLQDSDPAWGVDPRYRGRAYVAPSGHVAGIFARTDAERGVHKAPANAIVRGALEVRYYVSRPKQELLNPQGVNCIRLMNGDVTLWGARTVGGDRNGEWKYVSVRRFAGFLEESISRGTQWIVFEPNDPNLWSRIILNVTSFLTILWHNGALFGLTPQEAFYVKCDEELNPPEVRDLGMVVTEIGVAIVRPAEFVIFRITQSTGPQQG
jgi:phage tail sheath protein FI